MQATDAVLVGQARSGDQQAFAEIVSRYQVLVCSVAYATTGNLNASEDLAQEAFIAAWRSLAKLQDPDKLRSWLCGIARNLANNRLRKRNRDVLANASVILNEPFTEPADGPAKSSIAREEIELLDRTLLSMPETYRAPLVLFYREQQSVARVAEQLELSPSAVKQRLARGREMLRQEVTTIIERGLLQSAPGRAFTIGVLAAIPAMSGSAKAATITATATAATTSAKGVSLMSATSWVGITGAIAGPLLGIFGGWFGYVMSMKSARSDRERDHIRRMTFMMLALIAAATISLGAVLVLGRSWANQNPTAFAISVISLVIAYVLGIIGITIWSNRGLAQIRHEDGTVDMDVSLIAEQLPSAMRKFQYARRYDSKSRFLGLPLVSVRFSGASSVGKTNIEPAVGWVAISDRWAFSPLFACGSMAVGSIACGAFGIGILSFGGMALGVVALGGAALGWWASGGFVMAWMGFGGITLAWKAAIGGIAIGHDFAIGGIVLAQQANTAAAQTFVESSTFFRLVGLLMAPWGWMLLVAAMLTPMWIALRLVPPTQDSEAESV